MSARRARDPWRARQAAHGSRSQLSEISPRRRSGICAAACCCARASSDQKAYRDGLLEFDDLAVAVLAHLAFEGVDLVLGVELGQADKPHRQAAFGARRLQDRSLRVGVRMKLRHGSAHTAIKFADNDSFDLGFRQEATPGRL